MTTTITTTASNLNADGAHVAITAQHFYDAECALQAAHQSQVEAWIAAAADRLHDAVAEYLAATANRPQPQQLTVEQRSGKR